MTPARSETVHDLVTYLVTSWLSGLAVAVFTPLALGAAALDVVAGRGRADGSLSRVLQASAAFQAALGTRPAPAPPDEPAL